MNRNFFKTRINKIDIKIYFNFVNFILSFRIIVYIYTYISDKIVLSFFERNFSSKVNTRLFARVCVCVIEQFRFERNDVIIIRLLIFATTYNNNYGI